MKATLMTLDATIDNPTSSPSIRFTAPSNGMVWKIYAQDEAIVQIAHAAERQDYALTMSLGTFTIIPPHLALHRGETVINCTAPTIGNSAKILFLCYVSEMERPHQNK